MAFVNERDVALETALEAARAMCAAARTAPKAIGQDLLEIGIAHGETIGLIADHMIQMHREGRAAKHFLRDAENLRVSLVCVFIATRPGPEAPRSCAQCGVKACANNGHYAHGICTFAAHDMGLAVGSAVSVAADWRMDNRVMYSAGEAALELGLLGEKAVYAMGIPLSVTGKSPFFDRAALA